MLSIISCSVSNVGAYYDGVAITNNWVSWVNSERILSSISPVKIFAPLTQTAQSWSLSNMNSWISTHKRKWQKAYYDYKKMTSWFSGFWLQFSKIWTSTFSESIWWNTYSCKDSDCTESLKMALRKTFDMFLREKGRSYSPHYSSIINPDFKQIGVGLSVDEKKKRYYVVIHYAANAFWKE